jgi:alpha-mannosidase
LNNQYCKGGGITSPDNLLPHGESFIRNYLVGKKFLDEHGITWNSLGNREKKIRLKCYEFTCYYIAWLPDDFGHDSQLPVMLKAMNMRAVSMARLPGIESLLYIIIMMI